MPESESATLLDRAIIRAADIDAAALEGMPEDLSGLDDAGAITNIINAVSQQIDTKLGRRLWAHPRTDYFKAAQWEASQHPTYAFQVYAPHWPFIEATDGNTVATGDDDPGGQILYCNSRLESLASFSGYRREDQTLTKLQAITELATLVLLPEIFPADVTDVCMAIVLHIVQKRMAAQYGDQRVTQNVGTGQMTIDTGTSRFIHDQIERLADYR